MTIRKSITNYERNVIVIRMCVNIVIMRNHPRERNPKPHVSRRYPGPFSLVDVSSKAR